MCRGEAKGFKVGVKGRVREGMYPSRWGPGGCAFGKASDYRCMQVSFNAFSDKTQRIDARIYACKLW
jgi:hypothetical protein